MTTLKMDDDNNIIFENGNPAIVGGVDALKLSLKNRISLIVGEDIDNPENGIDFFTHFADSFGGVNYLTEKIRSRAISDPDEEIINIENLNVSYENKMLNISLTLNTVYGILRI